MASDFDTIDIKENAIPHVDALSRQDFEKVNWCFAPKFI